MDILKVEKTAAMLLDQVATYESCLIAYSGGVDSAVVAKACQLSLGPKAMAATGVSPAVSTDELDIARRVAMQIGIEHIELATSEIGRPDYVANGPDRCFHCKTELYSVLHDFRQNRSIKVIANGTNTEDLGDYRPGLQAADNANVRSPLVECDIDKSMVRQLAKFWQIEIWDKPASPCLASRVAYGQQVTPDRLRMIELAEKHLRSLGVSECRVRYHEGDLARIEVPLSEIESLSEPTVRAWLHQEFTEIGFKHVTIDLNGFQSGSLNAVLPILQQPIDPSSLLAEEVRRC